MLMEKQCNEKIAATKLFQEGIHRLLKDSEDYKIALMCAEKDPITCHRAILVCQYLRQHNLNINHILKNGDLETHTVLEERLLKEHNLTRPKIKKPVQLSLFDNLLIDDNLQDYCEEAIKEAYIKQGSLIAYVEKKEGKYEPANESVYNRFYSKNGSKIL
jgi:uncharacterized protein (DUF488 family)